MTTTWIHIVLIGALGLAGACGSQRGEAPLDAGQLDAGQLDAGRLDARPSDAPSPPPFPVTGCAATPTHPAAPGGYYVNGNTICTADGRPHLLHGVDRPSLEWSSGGENLSLADFRLMASWNANVVRIALNQDFWLAASPLFDPNYAGMVDSAVAWAETEGMDAILDLHWSDAGVLGGCLSTPTSGCQQQMPDVNSVTFWSEVATRYKGDGRVLFELYNEPHDVSWSVWKSGGAASDGFQAVGMQPLYDTVRATGAQNLVIIGGLNWAYDLSGVPANRIDGYNIAYATHPYGSTDGRSRPASDWGRAWGFLTVSDPVVVTEFGVLDDKACSAAYDAQLIDYADAHFVGWSAWAWFAGDCTTGFITLLDDWTGTPSPTGAIVKAALLGYGDPPASPPGARVDGPAIDYTFDHGAEGWLLDKYATGPTNLGAGVPDGGSRPTLRFAATEGDPSPGALELMVAFTAADQYVIANANFGQPGLDLSGKTLRARLRLVSGSLGDGRVFLGALSGPTYIVSETPPLDTTSLTLGAWVPVSLDLGAATAVGFDASKIVQIGVRVVASAASLDGGVPDDGSFAGTGDLVFQIDTVTD
jgi:endoglucanase